MMLKQTLLDIPKLARTLAVALALVLLSGCAASNEPRALIDAVFSDQFGGHITLAPIVFRVDGPRDYCSRDLPERIGYYLGYYLQQKNYATSAYRRAPLAYGHSDPLNTENAALLLAETGVREGALLVVYVDFYKDFELCSRTRFKTLEIGVSALLIDAAGKRELWRGQALVNDISSPEPLDYVPAALARQLLRTLPAAR